MSVYSILRECGVPDDKVKEVSKLLGLEILSNMTEVYPEVIVQDTDRALALKTMRDAVLGFSLSVSREVLSNLDKAIDEATAIQETKLT